MSSCNPQADAIRYGTREETFRRIPNEEERRRCPQEDEELGCTPREAKLRRIQRLGFMTDDLRLFLNTHPGSQEALAQLKRYLALERAAKQDYEQAYGPLTLEAMENRCQYDWICRPWPWEVEA